MKSDLTIDTFTGNCFHFFGHPCERKTVAWMIPADEIQGDRFQAAEAGSGYYAKSLHRPVARNGVKPCSRRYEGAKNSNVFHILLILTNL